VFGVPRLRGARREKPPKGGTPNRVLSIFNSLLEASARRYVAIFVSGRAIEIRTLLLALGLLLLLAPNVFGTEREE
jgi:hypothetical protein